MVIVIEALYRVFACHAVHLCQHTLCRRVVGNGIELNLGSIETFGKGNGVLGSVGVLEGHHGIAVQEDLSVAGIPFLVGFAGDSNRPTLCGTTGSTGDSVSGCCFIAVLAHLP